MPTQKRESPHRTPAGGRLPDFLIIGAAKSGTSSLHRYLSRHPGIYMPGKKEPDFFGLDERFAKGFGSYTPHFDPAGADRLTGEASTGYTRYPQYPNAAPRIAEALPHARLIYQVRDPVERAYSHYVHRVSRELFPGEPIRRSFEEHIERDPMCLDSSRYMLQLRQYLRFFSRDRFLVVQSKHLKADPRSALREICRFLGVDEEADLLGEGRVSRNRRDRFASWNSRRRITAPLKRVPGVARLAARLPQSWRDGVFGVLRRTGFGRRVERSYQPPPMLPETRRELIEWFEPGVRELSEFTGRDFSHWLVP